MEKNRLLGDVSDISMQAGLRYYSDVLMVNEDRTAIHIMQPYQEFEDRRFSSAGRTNDSYPFAGSGLQAKILFW